MSHMRDSLWIAGLLVSGLLIGAGLLLLVARASTSADAPLWGSLYTQGMWILVAVYGAALSRAPRLGERLGLGRGRLSPATALILVVGFIALSNGLHQGVGALELRETGSLAEIDAVVREARARAPSFLLALVAMGIAPGFGEEILFRGFVQGGLVPRLGPHRGILLSAALFALAHFDPVHSTLAFILGAYLGVVVQLAGGIRTAILCHVLNNTLGVLAPSLGFGLLRAQGAWLILPLLALAAIALLYAERQRRSAERRHEEASAWDSPRG